MKTQYKIFSLLLLFASLGLTSCINDSKDKDLVLVNDSLKLDQYSVRIKYTEPIEEVVNTEGEATRTESSDTNTISVKILEGAGEYSAFSLNSNVATATYDVENNTVVIDAKGIGKTRVVVLDAKTQGASIEVGVYQNDKISLKDVEGDLKLAPKVGEDFVEYFDIELGNGKFVAASSNEEIIIVGVEDDSKLILATPNGAVDGEAVVTIVDQFGFKYEVNVVVKTTTIPYTESELEELKDIISLSFRFNNVTANYRYNYTNKLTEEGVNIIGVSKSDYWSGDSDLKIYFKGDRSVRFVEDAEIEYSNFGGATLEGKAKLTYMNIFHTTEEHLYAAFSYLDESNVLRYGYFVVGLNP